MAVTVLSGREVHTHADLAHLRRTQRDGVVALEHGRIMRAPDPWSLPTPSSASHWLRSTLTVVVGGGTHFAGWSCVESAPSDIAANAGVPVGTGGSGVPVTVTTTLLCQGGAAEPCQIGQWAWGARGPAATLLWAEPYHLGVCVRWVASAHGGALDNVKGRHDVVSEEFTQYGGGAAG